MNDTKKSRFRGIAWHEGHKKWVAKTHAQGRYVTLGYFDAEEAAARMYDCAARYLRGPNANLNFDGLPPPGITTPEVYHLLRERGLVSDNGCQL